MLIVVAYFCLTLCNVKGGGIGGRSGTRRAREEGRDATRRFFERHASPGVAHLSRIQGAGGGQPASVAERARRTL